MYVFKHKHSKIALSLGILLVTYLLLSSAFVAFGQPAEPIVLHPISLDDAVDPLDGLDSMVLLNDDLIVPVDAGPYNVENLDVTLTGNFVEEDLEPRLDVIISVNVSMVSEIPADATFNLLMLLDSDLDPATGRSSPPTFHNGIGADWNLGCTVELGEVTFNTIQKYNPVEDIWEEVGETSAKLGTSSIVVEFDRADLGHPQAIQFMTYVITSTVTDMVPNPGDDPPIITFDFPPLAVIEAPSDALEGSEVLLNASTSLSFASPIVSYHWDLDGDGATDLTTGDSWASTSFPDDAVVQLSLTVETASGIQDSTLHLINVVNVPPSEVYILREGSLEAGEESTFKGGATDPGSDDLHYFWDFGDGETLDGAVVNHSYQSEGEFVVTLTVTDDDGGVGSGEMVLTVTPPPPIPVSISSSQIATSSQELTEGDEVVFTMTLICDGEEPTAGMLKLYLDDLERVSQPFWETSVTLAPGANEFVSPQWVSTQGDHVASFVVEGVGGDPSATEGSRSFNVEEKKSGPDLLPILIFFLGFIGVVVYLILTRTGTTKKKGKKEEEDDEKDFCEEHPEVVEQEKKACWEAQMDLESAIGDVQDDFDEAKPRWQSYSRTVGRLLAEWDSLVALIAHWTGAEEEMYETAEKVQQVAGFVQNATSKAAKAFKEGGEDALKEVGEDFVKDVGKSILGEVSETLGNLLELEDWAIREIGTGIARGLTGIDPRRNASRLRAKSEEVLDDLMSWISHSHAWNSGRRPPDTLHSCIEEMQKMLDAIDQAIEDFNNAVKDFRCIECEIPDHILKDIDQLTRNLQDFMKAFGDLIDQVEQRLKQARSIYNRKDVYEGPLEHTDKSQRHTRYINKILNDSASARPK